VRDAGDNVYLLLSQPKTLLAWRGEKLPQPCERSLHLAGEGVRLGECIQEREILTPLTDIRSPYELAVLL
jgi:hypothetical protein